MTWDEGDIGTRRVSFDCGNNGKAVFIPRCECGRFVRADDHIFTNDFGLKDATNATCKKCGRVKMHFEGFL